MWFARSLGGCVPGPSMNVNSACSSGLVAVSQAAQSIAAGACEMAIAGASSLTFPNMGYLYEENLVCQPRSVAPRPLACNHSARPWANLTWVGRRCTAAMATSGAPGQPGCLPLSYSGNAGVKCRI